MSRHDYVAYASARGTTSVAHVPNEPVTLLSVEVTGPDFDVSYVQVGNTIVPAFRKRRAVCLPSQTIVVHLEHEGKAASSVGVVIRTEPARYP